MDGHRTQAMLAEERRHEVGVPLRDAEGQRSAASALLELVEGVLCPRPSGHVTGELVLVEPGVAPGDVAVVDLVGNAEYLETAEQVARDPFHQVAAVDEILLAQARRRYARRRALRRGLEVEKDAAGRISRR